MKKWWNNNYIIVLLVVISIIAVGTIATSITACAMYCNKPVTEIPAWALIFMFNRGGK